MRSDFLSEYDYLYLMRQFSQGMPILFAGAGLCWDVVDSGGARLPIGRTLAEELWGIAFPGEPFDDSASLHDVYHTCHQLRPKDLVQHLSHRLTVDHGNLPDYLFDWLRAPWSKIYSLNIDTLPQAANYGYSLPRRLTAISATSDDIPLNSDASSLQYIHLNGTLQDLPDKVVFSRRQYAVRAATSDPWYGLVASDICGHPVVFVGSELDEPDLWRYIEIRHLRGGRQNRELRPKSFLVTPFLNKAKAFALKEYNIIHVPATAEQFAHAIFGEDFQSPSQQGQAELRQRAAENSTLVVDVAAATLPPVDSASTNYLAGADPEWSDLVYGRAIRRKHDKDAARFTVDEHRGDEPRVLVVTGTAGSGKSTCLMGAAMAATNSGLKCVWLPADGDTDIRRIASEIEKKQNVTHAFIDDADRFGTSLSTLINALLGHRVLCISIAMRSSKVDRLFEPWRSGSANILTEEVVCGYLDDEEIDRLLELLEKEHRLGKLKGKSHAQRRKAFKTVAGRQLIVAMIEATTGKKFKDKIRSEYTELASRTRTLYLAAAVATSRKSSLSRNDMLRIGGDFDNDTLNALDSLIKRQLIRVVPHSGRLRLRHRVVADEVVREAAERGDLERSIRALVFVLSTDVNQRTRKEERHYKLLRSLLQYRFLCDILTLDASRVVYASVEDLLEWNAHFWLQRGSLEVAQGSLEEARRYLDTALSLDPSNWLVRTEYAYYLFRRSMQVVESAEAREGVQEAMNILTERIAATGGRDAHPYHVIGSQGLKWARERNWIGPEKQSYLANLHRIVSEGERRHPRDQRLAGLAREIKTEELKRAVVM